MALYRPGPLNAGMARSFIARKNGEEPVEYPHPSLREVLDETYGVYAYQEQVMGNCAHIVGLFFGRSRCVATGDGQEKAR